MAKMKNCSVCNAEIASNAKACPSCGAKNKKPIYLRWWFILIVVIVLLGAIGSLGGEDTETPEPQNVASDDMIEEPAEDETSVAPEESEKPVVSEPEKPANTEPEMTIGQKNALSKAKIYLSSMPFSHSGLVTQLEFEGFSNADAVWAVDRCGADWMEQAGLKAKQYMDSMAFSKQGLIDQLLFEGFSSEQAAYGASYVGY